MSLWRAGSALPYATRVAMGLAVVSDHELFRGRGVEMPHLLSPLGCRRGGEVSGGVDDVDELGGRSCATWLSGA